MQASPRALRNTLVGIVLLVGIAGPIYAYVKSIPAPVAAALTAAFAIEAAMYFLPGFTVAREFIEKRMRAPVAALAMTASAIIPYCVYSIPTGVFEIRSLALLALLAAAVSFWYVVLPRHAAIDLIFVAFVAAVVLKGPFRAIYTSPAAMRIDILGAIMWTRLALLECLSIARMTIPGFGFLPNRREWGIGLLHFIGFLPVAALLAWRFEIASFHMRPIPVWQTALLALVTFIGILWFVAVPEEVFFRGLLQQWFSRWLRSGWAGLLAASVLFGLAHLPFRHFPNWRFAILAGVAGLFYGRAYAAAGSVRAAFIPHALAVTIWKVFLR